MHTGADGFAAQSGLVTSVWIWHGVAYDDYDVHNNSNIWYMECTGGTKRTPMSFLVNQLLSVSVCFVGNWLQRDSSRIAMLDTFYLFQ